MRKITKHFTQKQGGGVYMAVSLPTIPGSSVGDPGPSDLLHCRTSVMTTLRVTMVTITCFTMVAVLLTTVMAVPAQGSQNSNDQALEPGQDAQGKKMVQGPYYQEEGHSSRSLIK
ncbi:uncharacterized protein LOC124137531 isoform X1 [Haliotis rufescens]|uniref:uncharacterized protein LOC124137531 isoform X1 n=2 Tax=Haliotis rufescens TaxID=6454 RepID=UPI00201F8A80|nr:uncharacterized protein LOC124137531 isoform X1 [Haliotis rufescens]